jgi:hypothetical protein
MTTTTPQAPETNSQNENGLLDAYKTKEDIEKLYLDSSTLDEKLSDKEITEEVYKQIKNQPVINDLNNIDVKSIRSLREYLLKQPDCPEFLKQCETEASAKRSELVK